jgi:hypothetical protein
LEPAGAAGADEDPMPASVADAEDGSGPAIETGAAYDDPMPAIETGAEDGSGLWHSPGLK